MLRFGFALCVLLSASASAERWATPDLGRKLVTGGWNERISAVNQLGERGQAAFPELCKALDDPDWQVRLSAVHWVGRLGRPAAGALEGALAREKCPLVRLAALHRLGRLGARSPAASVGGGKGLAACKSWTWPLTEDYLHTRRKKPKPVEKTKLDEKGCQYIQFKRSGRSICPQGFLLKGVGSAPGHVNIMKKGRPPKSGVALCCLAAREEATQIAAPPQPQEVECRLHPIECPAPWVEMEPPDNRLWTRKNRKFIRTQRMKDGALTWIHCCRPHQTGGSEYFPPPKTAIARTLSPPPPRAETAGEPLADYREVEEDGRYEDFDTMPERDIAERMLAKKAERSRPPARSAPPPEPEEAPAVAEQEEKPPADDVDAVIRERAFEDLLRALEKELPASAGVPEREEPEYPAAAALEARDRDLPEHVLEARELLGAPADNLPGPSGLPGRAGRPVTADATLERSARPSETPPMEELPADHGPPEERLAAPAGIASRSVMEVDAPAVILEDGGKIVRHDPLPELLRQLRDESPLLRSRAADELGRLGAQGEKAVPLLKGALKDRNSRVRSSAALALGNVTAGSDAALKELKRALKDDYVDVRYSAATALGRLGTPAARKAFDRHMRAETRRFLRK